MQMKRLYILAIPATTEIMKRTARMARRVKRPKTTATY